MFEKIKRYYDEGLWTVEMVRNAVVKRKITPADFFEITGIRYS